LLHSDLKGPVNLGNCGELSVLELARLIIELTGSSSEIIFVDRPQDDPTVRRPDITRARTALGWEPKVTFNELVSLMVNADVSMVVRDEHEGFGDTNMFESPISVSS